MSKKYQVVKGDSLWGLAERFYGDGSLYPVISDHILLGQMLEIPYVTFRHRVAAGDTKPKLAVHYYHDETMSEPHRTSPFRHEGTTEDSLRGEATTIRR